MLPLEPLMLEYAVIAEEQAMRGRLIEVREKRGFTQESLAERLGVDVATIRRWEHGDTTPQGRNKWKLLDVLGASSEEELDLGHKAPQDVGSTLHSLVKHSFVAYLVMIVFSDIEHVSDLQDKVKILLGELAVDSLSRREALYVLAALPLTPDIFPSENAGKSTDEILRRVAAGITACEFLSKGNGIDMREASKALISYLPPLKTIAHSSPSSKKRAMASTLLTQAFIRKAVLATHLTNTKAAASYAKQAVEYAEASGNMPLLISAQVWHAWSLFSDNQMSSAMYIALQALNNLECAKDLPASMCSSVRSVTAKYQALNRQKEDALKTLYQARNDFDAIGNERVCQHVYLDHSLDVLTLVEGMVYYYIGDATQAYEIIANVIDPETLQPKIEVSSERLRIEAINDLTLASLKLPSPRKDKELSVHLWKAGLAGALNLRSEQRLNEAIVAHHMMEALWADDDNIADLRRLIVHW